MEKGLTYPPKHFPIYSKYTLATIYIFTLLQSQFKIQIMQLNNFRRRVSFHPDRLVFQVFIAPVRTALNLQNKSSLIFKCLAHTKFTLCPTGRPKELSEKQDGKNWVESLATHKQFYKTKTAHADHHSLAPQTELILNSSINPNEEPQTQGLILKTFWIALLFKEKEKPLGA